MRGRAGIRRQVCQTADKSSRPLTVLCVSFKSSAERLVGLLPVSREGMMFPCPIHLSSDMTGCLAK